MVCNRYICGKNSVIKLHLKLLSYLFVILWVLTGLGNLRAQSLQESDSLTNVSLPNEVESLVGADSLGIPEREGGSDSLSLADTLSLQTDSLLLATDSLQVKPKKSKSGFDDIIDYQAVDSISFSLTRQVAGFYHESDIKYGDVAVQADTVLMEIDKKTIHAWGGADSTGLPIGEPVFTQGGESFETQSFSYNYDTKRGTIRALKTHQGESFLHAEKSKRYENGDIHMADGKITTCEADHPHFYLHTNRAKSMPGDKIIFGFSYMVLEDVPLPLVLPFGLVPDSNKKSVAGLIPPSFGIETTRGMYLTNGGYYHPFGDVADVQVTGDYYTGGTWGVNLASRYIVKYKFSGNLMLRYYVNISGEKGINETKGIDYSIKWSHSQDAKANPYRSFSASVNFSTSKFEQNQNYTNSSALMTNTKTSSISYRQNWPNSPFHLTVNANHSQNSNTEMVNLILPSATFSMDRIYPFKRKIAIGETRWYENIGLTYNAEMKNSLSAKEDVLFDKAALDKMQNGFSHSIPLSINFKVLKLFNVTPSISYKGVMYLQKVKKYYDYKLNSETYGKVVTDTIRGFNYGHSVSPSLAVSFTPKFYLTGTMKNKNAKIQAIRYVFSPSASVSYVPDMSDFFPNYYKTYQDSTGKVYTYSQFEGGIYGTPSFAKQSGSISLSVNNNVEMKVRSARDTVSSIKKVKLFERLSLSTSYNMFADSMNWSNISVSTGIRLTEKINLDIRGTLDPYCIDENGRRYNKMEISENHRLGRLTSASFGTSYTLSSEMFTKKQSESSSSQPNGQNPQSTNGQSNAPNSGQPPAPAVPVTGDYHYFNVPWSISFNYNFNYSKSGINKANITQSLTCSGSIKLTDKWSTNFSSGYDFEAHEITHTNFNITRDLHCWEMSMSFSPFGVYKYYSFTINVKSSILRDLKYDQKKDRRDYAEWD